MSWQVCYLWESHGYIPALTDFAKTKNSPFSMAGDCIPNQIDTENKSCEHRRLKAEENLNGKRKGRTDYENRVCETYIE